MDEDLRILEQEFSPPIDPGLIAAIYLDFAGQEDAINSTKQFLDILKISAAEEQLTEFEPSGYRLSDGVKGCNDIDHHPNTSSLATPTITTEASTLSSGLSHLSVGERSDSSSQDPFEEGYYKDSQTFDLETKELLLIETFPSLSREKITFTLKRCGKDFTKATDELLNHVYFESTRTGQNEDGLVVKGIDAFSEDYYVPRRGRKGKTKKKNQTVTLQNERIVASSNDTSVKSPPNHWQKASRDVEFISSHTNVTTKEVYSVYHANGASLPVTILQLVMKDINKHEQDEVSDPALVQDAIALHEDFPTVDLKKCLAIIRLSAPSTSKAHQLAKALTQKPLAAGNKQDAIQVDLRYAPISLSEPVIESSHLLALNAVTKPRDVEFTARARNEAFQQASAAHRKGRSTPLMRAAAGYYAQQGRDLNAKLKDMSATNADAFVSTQSGPTYIDLHGIIVADATRIAKQRTQSWWDALGERNLIEWAGAGRRGGGDVFKIITGLGRHSEGGRGKLGPAVAKTLVNEGWKVEVQPGEILVTGRTKRR